MQTRVLMVCLGNICRSPLAEGILKSKIDSQIVFVDSAGTAGYHIGNNPDKRSVSVAKKFTKASLASIGSQIGKRDHATVLHACKTVDNLAETDKQFRKYIEDLTKKFS